jgi:hypothetical protein
METRRGKGREKGERRRMNRGRTKRGAAWRREKGGSLMERERGEKRSFSFVRCYIMMPARRPAQAPTETAWRGGRRDAMRRERKWMRGKANGSDEQGGG